MGCFRVVGTANHGPMPGTVTLRSGQYVCCTVSSLAFPPRARNVIRWWNDLPSLLQSTAASSHHTLPSHPHPLTPSILFLCRFHPTQKNPNFRQHHQRERTSVWDDLIRAVRNHFFMTIVTGTLWSHWLSLVIYQHAIKSYPAAAGRVII